MPEDAKRSLKWRGGNQSYLETHVFYGELPNANENPAGVDYMRKS